MNAFQKTNKSFLHFPVLVLLSVLLPSQMLAQTVIKPLVVTQQVANDSDDPAVWINRANPAASLVIGTDKNSDGALYVFDLQGKIIQNKLVDDLDRPNNVDVAYGLQLGGTMVDIAVTTERLAEKLRVFALPDMRPIDGGGIPVFTGESGSDRRAPMGIGLYKRPGDGKLFAIVSRAAGPTNGTYLWQYLLEDDGKGNVKGTLVRKFGNFSGKEEIEAVAVDNELGYVYYSDEQVGVRKYYADPDRGNQELALFATSGFGDDQEGIALYKIEDGTGYILVSDQRSRQIHVYPREGTSSNPHSHPLLKVVGIEAKDTDGIEVVNYPLSPQFPNGMLVAMSSNKTFHYYRWEDVAGNDLKIQPPGTGALQAPALSSPANGATGVSLMPTLQWQASSGADSYQLQVATSSDFGTTTYDQSGIGSTSASLGEQAGNTRYYWRVRASNATSVSGWSAVWSFTTGTDTSPPPVGGELAGHWKMDEGKGDVLLDASGQGNNADIKGSPSWVEGVRGLALKLENNKKQYALVPSAASLNISGAITLAAWIKPEKKETQGILKKAINGQTDGYELSLSNSGKVFVRFNYVSSGNSKRLNSTASYPTNGKTWMHVAATYDGSVMRIYINGVEDKSKRLNAPFSISKNSLPLAIGAQPDGKKRFGGALDDLRVYARALSAAEIRELSAGNALARQLSDQSDSRRKPVISEQKQFSETSLRAYPNPFSEHTRLEFSLDEPGDYTLTLYDMKGLRVTLLQEGKAQAGELNTLILEGSTLAKGLYLIRLQTSQGTKTLKLIQSR